MPEQTIDRETVTIPRKHVGQLLTTIIKQIEQDGSIDETAKPALRYVWAVIEAAPKGGDTFTLDAEAAWRLQMESSAMSLYDLDECADATYEHPAVKAENEVTAAIVTQAPSTFDRLSEALMAEGVLATDAQTVTFD
jgi:hypothetical protein